MPPILHTATTFAARALFARATDDPNKSCPRPLTDDPAKPLVGNVTLHQLMVYISAACLILTVISCWFLTWRHLHRYTSTQEQRQIIRIINLPVAYGLFNFLALTFTVDYMYIEPIGAIYEAFTVAALFFLILEWVAPDGTDREKYFDQLELRDRRGNVQPGGSLKWFQRTWSSVLQYPLTKTVFVIIQIITQYFGDYCEGSFSPKHAHLYLFLADLLFIGGALGASVQFFRRLARECAPIHRPRPKVYTFLGIVAFQFLQGIIFHLMNGKIFNPTATATYNDINFGIASFMTCIEAVIFSLIFHWSYSSTEYKEGTKPDRLGMGPARRIGTGKAILDALNMSDVIAGTFLALQMLLMRVQSRYGNSAGGPQRYQDPGQVNWEPLTDRRPMRDPSPAGDETENFTSYGSPPPHMPPPRRDLSPGVPQTQPLMAGHGYARSLSPARVPMQQPGYLPPQEPRQMI